MLTRHPANLRAALPILVFILAILQQQNAAPYQESLCAVFLHDCQKYLDQNPASTCHLPDPQTRRRRRHPGRNKTTATFWCSPPQDLRFEKGEDYERDYGLKENTLVTKRKELAAETRGGTCGFCRCAGVDLVRTLKCAQFSTAGTAKKKKNLTRSDGSKGKGEKGAKAQQTERGKTPSGTKPRETLTQKGMYDLGGSP